MKVTTFCNRLPSYNMPSTRGATYFRSTSWSSSTSGPRGLRLPWSFPGRGWPLSGQRWVPWCRFSTPTKPNHGFCKRRVHTSVPDPYPNQDPLDPHVFQPPGSGSTSQRYGSGSGSFYHQAKLVKKTLIPTVLWLL